jgi:hypothetical protein
VFATGEQQVNRERQRRFFDQRQQASMALVGPMIGVIGAVLLVFSDRWDRGLFLILMAVIFTLIGASAWSRLPKDQRSFKALRSPR